MAKIPALSKSASPTQRKETNIYIILDGNRYPCRAPTEEEVNAAIEDSDDDDPQPNPLPSPTDGDMECEENDNSLQARLHKAEEDLKWSRAEVATLKEELVQSRSELKFVEAEKEVAMRYIPEDRRAEYEQDCPHGQMVWRGSPMKTNRRAGVKRTIKDVEISDSD